MWSFVEHDRLFFTPSNGHHVVFICLFQNVQLRVDLVHFLYVGVGHGDIMQSKNLGVKRVVLHLVGDAYSRKKGGMNLNFIDEFEKNFLHGA
jgi:hypothetical protein